MSVSNSIASSAATPSRRADLDWISWMIWKDNRLVMPLFGTLVAVGLLIVVVIPMMMRTTFSRDGSDYLYMALLFPTLLAAGLPFVLIGQERELRTLDWLRSLPLLTSRLIYLKFGIALAWLLGAWLLSGLFLLAADDGGVIQYFTLAPNHAELGRQLLPMNFLFWCVQSLFVLAAGFYGSWRFHTAFRSLLCMFAIAIVPTVFNITFSSTRTLSPDAWFVATFWFMVILTPIVAWLALRAAHRALAPATAPKSMQRFGADSIERSLSPVQAAGRMSLERPFVSIQSALNWQTLVANRSVIFSLIAMIVAGVLLPMLGMAVEGGALATGALAALVLLVPLAIAWFGTLAFQTDGSAERLRFLSDRGVSPTIAFMGRHLPMLSVLAMLTVLYTVFVSFLASSPWAAENENDWMMGIPSPATMIVFAVIMYSAAQWFSQLVRGPVLAFLVSPIIAGVITGWLFTAHGSFLAPIWYVGLIGFAVPMLATWLLMKRFMDGTERPISFVIAFAVAMLLVLLPVIPAYRYVNRLSGMPDEMRESLSQEAIQVHSVPTQLSNTRLGFPAGYSEPKAIQEARAQILESRSLRELLFLPDHEHLADATLEWLDAKPDQPDELIDGLSRLESDPLLGAFPGTDWFEARLFATIDMAKLRFLQDEQENAQSLQSFIGWLDAVSHIVRGFRQGGLVKTQAFADRLEIWLADTLTHPESIKRLSTEDIRRIVRRLPSRSQRAASRRRAVLAMWGSYLTQNPRYRRFSLDRGLEYTPTSLIPWTKDKRAELIVMATLEAAEQAKSGPIPPEVSLPWRERMHQANSNPITKFADGVYGNAARSKPAIDQIRGAFDDRFVARYWGMAWEQQIEKLQEQNDE